MEEKEKKKRRKQNGGKLLHLSYWHVRTPCVLTCGDTSCHLVGSPIVYIGYIVVTLDVQYIIAYQIYQTYEVGSHKTGGKKKQGSSCSYLFLHLRTWVVLHWFPKHVVYSIVIAWDKRRPNLTILHQLSLGQPSEESLSWVWSIYQEPGSAAGAAARLTIHLN